MTPAERNTAWALAQARQEAKDARAAARTAVLFGCLSMVAAIVAVVAS